MGGVRRPSQSNGRGQESPKEGREKWKAIQESQEWPGVSPGGLEGWGGLSDGPQRFRRHGRGWEALQVARRGRKGLPEGRKVREVLKEGQHGSGGLSGGTAVLGEFGCPAGGQGKVRRSSQRARRRQEDHLEVPLGGWRGQEALLKGCEGL